MSQVDHQESHALGSSSSSSSSSSLEDILSSLESRCPLEVANEINSLALVKHFMFKNPVEALQLHLIALKIEIECTKQLGKETEKIDDMELQEKRKSIASNIVITLTDIGNCFWSSQILGLSKVAYENAKSIYNLMDISSPLLAMSLSNRLGKLSHQTSEKNFSGNDNTYHSAFERCIDITKYSVERFTAALFNEL